MCVFVNEQAQSLLCSLTLLFFTDFWTLWEKVRVGWFERIASISFLKYFLFKLTRGSVKVWQLWWLLSYPEHNITCNSVGIASISDALSTTEFHLYKSQIHRVRKYIGRCQGLGAGVRRANGELVSNEDRVPVLPLCSVLSDTLWSPRL